MKLRNICHKNKLSFKQRLKFLSLEKQILKKGLLRIKEHKDKEVTYRNLRQFLYDFFYQYNIWCYTENLEKTEESGHSRRSLIDLFRLVRYYDKSVSLFELYTELANLIKENHIKVFYCTTIERQVYMLPRIWAEDYFLEHWQKDELELDILKDFKLKQR